MASPAEHLARAAANEALAERLAKEGELNWAVTVFFYAAVHHAGALLARSGIDTEGLDHITTVAKLDSLHTAIRSHYMRLQGMSRRARYLPGHQADLRTVGVAALLCSETRNYQERVMAGKVPGR